MTSSSTSWWHSPPTALKGLRWMRKIAEECHHDVEDDVMLLLPKPKAVEGKISWEDGKAVAEAEAEKKRKKEEKEAKKQAKLEAKRAEEEAKRAKAAEKAAKEAAAAEAS